MLIIQLKVMGFSMAEANDLTMRDYLALVEKYMEVNEIPKTSGGAPRKRRRKGTPAEFAAMFGGVG